jgi:hypothetical protein
MNKFILFILVFWGATKGWGYSPTFVQQVSGAEHSGATTLVISVPLTGAGDILIVGVNYTATLQSVSWDAQALTQQTATGDAGLAARVFYLNNIPAALSNLTITTSGGITNAIAAEYSQQNLSTPWGSTNVFTSNSSDLISADVGITTAKLYSAFLNIGHTCTNTAGVNPVPTPDSQLAVRKVNQDSFGAGNSNAFFMDFNTVSAMWYNVTNTVATANTCLWGMAALELEAAPSPTNTPTFTASPTVTATFSASPTSTFTASPTMTATPSASPTASPTYTPTPGDLISPCIDLTGADYLGPNALDLTDPKYENCQ